MEIHLTDSFSNRIAGAFGRAGVQWLRELPYILDIAADLWSIKLLPPFGPLSYNYVAPAVSNDGEPVVLKVGVPNREFSSEIDALRHFGGRGTVRLIRDDAKEGIMLLERVVPGVPLQRLEDDNLATAEFARVMRQLKRSQPDNHHFPSVADWAEGFVRLRNRFDGKTGPFPVATIDRAQGLASELIDSMSDSVVLHGDLHHWNILSAEREPWLALDPKGVTGEPEYEVGAWLRNPFPQILDMPKPRDFVARRVDQLAEELGFNRERLIGWAFSQAVLAGVWSLEDNLDDWDRWLACANHIGAMLP